MAASYYLLVILLICSCHDFVEQQSLLGTHFYVNQDRLLVDNTLKTVTTLARPYDLVTFIRQSERLARVEHLQTYIDAVDDMTESLGQQSKDSIDIDLIENDEQCHDFLRDGESLIFKILKTHLYDPFHIPLELKNISLQSHDQRTTPTIVTCDHYCRINTSKYCNDRLTNNVHLLYLFQVYLHSIIY
jgi:hypothetical protein